MTPKAPTSKTFERRGKPKKTRHSPPGHRRLLLGADTCIHRERSGLQQLHVRPQVADEAVLAEVRVTLPQELQHKLGADADSQLIPLRRIGFRRIRRCTDREIHRDLVGRQQRQRVSWWLQYRFWLSFSLRRLFTARGATICAFGSKLLARTAFTASNKKS